MEPISTILATAIGYILKGAVSSKSGQKAKEEFLEGFWSWVRPLFIKDVPEIETDPNSPETERKVSQKLVELIEKDESFLNELLEKIDILKRAGIKEKNIVIGNIKGVKKIKIGDKTYSTDEVFDRKNIVQGNIEDADEFILGDGH